MKGYVNSIGCLLLMTVFFSCEEKELVATVNEVVDEKSGYIIGDSILLRGNNLHKVTDVYLVIGRSTSTTKEVNFRNRDVRPKGSEYEENELLVFIPEDAQLFGKSVKFEMYIKEEFEQGLGRKDVTPQGFKILTPKIKSISSFEIIYSKDPVIVEIENLYLKKSELLFEIYAYYTEVGFNTWTDVDYEVVDNNRLLLKKVLNKLDVYTIKLEVNRMESSSLGSYTSDFSMVLGEFHEYRNYDVNTSQSYAPGSAIWIEYPSGGTAAYLDSVRIGAQYTVGSLHGAYRVPTIHINPGQEYEVFVPKIFGYLNLDNSHNKIEIIEGLYRITSQSDGIVNIATNVKYFAQLLKPKVVDQNGIVTDLRYKMDDTDFASMENSGMKLFTESLAPGQYTLKISSGDYELKPAGNISFSIQ